MSSTPPPLREYINHTQDGTLLPAQGKANHLIIDGAVEVTEQRARSLCDLKDIVLVVENDLFDAALHIACRETLEVIDNAVRGGDTRPRRWLYYPPARTLAGREYLTEFCQKHQ